MNRSRLALVLASIALLALACGEEPTPPEARAVTLETTACGHASRTSGAGVIVEDGWVLASAHVVAGAGSVEVTGSALSAKDVSAKDVPAKDVSAKDVPAEIVVFDAASDLALLRVDGVTAKPVTLGDAGAGDIVYFGGGGPSGAPTASITRPVEVRIEGVRSTERIRRRGYEIDRRVELGDSGGGLFDEQGRLVGSIFGRPLDELDSSFAVRRIEIERVLTAERDSIWECDPTGHRVIEQVIIEATSK